MGYTDHTVSTYDDIQKKIDIEVASLMYFEYKRKEDAQREAKIYVENRYRHVIVELKSKGLY